MAEHACDRCGHKPALPLIYGYPDAELMERASEGKALLGGCLLEDDAPRWLCRRCADARAENHAVRRDPHP